MTSSISTRQAISAIPQQLSTYSAGERGPWPGVALPAQRPSLVLVADPERVVSGFLRPALVDLAGCRVIEAGSLSAVNDIVDSGLSGDVAMVSVRFRSKTTAVIATLRAAGWPRIIALVPPSVEAAVVIEVFTAGAVGVVTTAGVDVPAPDDQLPVHALTTRELDVVRLVAQGMPNKEIAERLELSPLTVKCHLSRIARKLGVGDRAHIVAMACRGQVLGETA